MQYRLLSTVKVILADRAGGGCIPHPPLNPPVASLRKSWSNDPLRLLSQCMIITWLWLSNTMWRRARSNRNELATTVAMTVLFQCLEIFLFFLRECSTGFSTFHRGSSCENNRSSRLGCLKHGYGPALPPSFKWHNLVDMQFIYPNFQTI